MIERGMSSQVSGEREVESKYLSLVVVQGKEPGYHSEREEEEEEEEGREGRRSGQP
jgi:hypothetical protein